MSKSQESTKLLKKTSFMIDDLLRTAHVGNTCTTDFVPVENCRGKCLSLTEITRNVWNLQYIAFESKQTDQTERYYGNLILHLKKIPEALG